MDLVNISTKIISIEEMQIVGKDKLKLANALISDGTETIILELWAARTNKCGNRKWKPTAWTKSVFVFAMVQKGLAQQRRLAVRRRTAREHFLLQRGNKQAASTKSIKIDNINSIEKLKTLRSASIVIRGSSRFLLV